MPDDNVPTVPETTLQGRSHLASDGPGPMQYPLWTFSHTAEGSGQSSTKEAKCQTSYMQLHIHIDLWLECNTSFQDPGQIIAQIQELYHLLAVQLGQIPTTLLKLRPETALMYQPVHLGQVLCTSFVVQGKVPPSGNIQTLTVCDICWV